MMKSEMESRLCFGPCVHVLQRRGSPSGAKYPTGDTQESALHSKGRRIYFKGYYYCSLKGMKTLAERMECRGRRLA